MGHVADRMRWRARRAESRARAAIDPRHARARAAYERLRLYKDLDDESSRESELIEYFGFEVASRARASKRRFFEDDPKHARFLERLGIDYWQWSVMHQYMAFNRLDPQRPDLFWLYDGVLERLEALGGAGAVSVLDFGCSLGQIGLAFAQEGYRTVSCDRDPEELAFCRFLFENRGLEPEIVQARDENDYFDTAGAGGGFGCVVEWSVLEHVNDVRAAAEAITRGLLPGGVFVTTTLGGEWTAGRRAYYERDSGDAAIAAQLFSDDLAAWVDEHFDVVEHPRSVGRVLVKRA